MRIIGILFISVFGFVFAAAGGFILNQTAVSTYRSWQEMQSWQPAQATLLKLAGRRNDTLATYTYEVYGVTYRNDRVYVAAFKDNIGSYHQDLYRRLSQYKQSGRTITIWYNPTNHQESVIDREMRWGLFALTTGFALVFVLVGLGVVIAGLRKGRSTGANMPSLAELKREWRANQSNPDYAESYFDFIRRTRHELKKQQAGPVTGGSRWLQKKEWQTNRIRSGARRGVVAMWAFAVIWNAISIPSLFFIPKELAKGNYAVLLVLLFPLVSIFIVVKAIQSTLEWLRFGKLEVVMDPFPGAIGGHVGGYLDIPNIHDPSARYEVALDCVYSYVSGTGKNRSRSERVAWGEKGVAGITPMGDRLRLEFRFDVPEHLTEADVDQTGDYYYHWRLKFHADIAGADLKREFNIPVFKTGAQSQSATHDISARVNARREEQARESQAALQQGRFEETALARALRYRHEHGQTRFYYPMFRNKALTLVSAVFAGGFGFGVYSMHHAFSGGGWASIFITLFSIPFALVALVAGIAVVYLPLNNLSVSIGQGKLKVLRRLFIIPVYQKTLSAGGIKEFAVKRSGSTGQGAEKIEHFKVFAVTHRNEKVTVAENIDGSDLANQFKDLLRQKLGIV